MKNKFLKLVLILFSTSLFAQADKVMVENNDEGIFLSVNGEKLMINGMNWGYVPIGTNYSYSLWKQSDDVIKAALDAEMGLLRNMGVNAIRQYTGIQPKWITYIYENYGIYTMLNHSFGRYGLTLNGGWEAVTDYRDPETQKVLMSEITELAETYKNTPGLLMFLLGNENNYGLFWAGAETEDFPEGEEQLNAVGEKRGRPMYKLMNDAAVKMKSINASIPIAICNGDLLFIDIIAEECKDVDIYGTNMYRGVSFGDAFQQVKDKLNKPILFTEFGSDAFNAIENQEDQKMQAYYDLGNWQDIYQNAAGLGKAENSIGGFTFQFSDGWWKFGQTKNLEVHDTNASWANGGYEKDLAPGENNMNEEWFGICAKGPTNSRGLYELYPRAAYYALKEAHNIDPYAEGATLDYVNNAFSNIEIMDAVLRARGDKAAMGGNEKIKLSNLRAEFTTFNTGGNLITTPSSADEDESNYPNQLGFDHMQSYYIGVEGNPASNMRANVNFNVLGNVAANPIDEIFYENTGQPISVNTDDGNVDILDPNRVKVYNAEFEWNAKEFDLRGFYRIGHYHWAYEGDFFNLYPEANYGDNLDIYNGEVLGFEVDGKKGLKGLKAAFGPQLWWGANPAVLLKYQKQIGKFDLAAVYHEDIDDIGEAVSSYAIPIPKTRRLTVYAKRQFGDLGLEVGGIWGGQPLNGRTFQNAENNPNYDASNASSSKYIIYQDEINSGDNWGAKAKVTYSKGAFNWYAQGAAMGLVANGGADQTQTYTGWKLKDSGSGNQTNVLSGFTYSFGEFQIAPNFLWQKPIVDAMPNDVTGTGRLRNVQDDPFAVRSNRETTAGEILFTYDPTPGTWMYEWDNDRSEDAKFAMNFGFVYRHQPTATDAAIGFLADRTSFAFDNSAPAQDLWEANTRLVSKINPDLGLIANFYAGNGQANGDSERVINRVGGDIRVIYNKLKLVHSFKINDWGPFDYHRDYNMTYPVQLMLDLSTTLGKPDWFILPDTKIGIRGTWRSLDQYSNRYSPMATEDDFSNEPIISPVGFGNGNEWEIRTYIHINIGK
ncbi:glycoside hydrolase family 2 TIM barrel-domain containing protein [Algibacter miyuki]|uniref:Glycoside hydrolase family 2 TIM barrel-domain containing protein n=1 Tax=Algibacter miyuki TaxID=1306933 RepID=A0ABV5GV30_9FLAO|nr:glycoside hydrolase family 2 TIM barrel-domain containing protein [Algibacter miyuki]MDN3664826.1 glycoside hydrolase family 2 TIM barrel-domain containing protein [Algibacter miyuki]